MIRVNIPIYRAKKLGSDEDVEGYLVEVVVWEDETPIKGYAIAKKNKGSGSFNIDPSTLAISFDGKEWRDLDYVKKAVEQLDYIEKLNDGEL